MVSKKSVNVIQERALVYNPSPYQKILTYGANNLYPQVISELIYASKTASLSVERLSEAIECEGFFYEAFANRKNDRGETLDDILNTVAYDIARFRGCAMIVQYGFDYLPKALYPVPFEYVRASLNDNYLTDRVVHKWTVFDNWEGRSSSSTNKNETGVEYPTFNKESFREECEDFGGIEHHPGQLLYVNFFTTKPYPLSPFHAVQSEMQTEALNSTRVQKTLMRGFHSCSIVSHGDFAEQEEQDEFVEGITDMMGSDNAGSVITVRNENISEGKPWIKVDNLGTPIDSDTYTAYTEPLKKDIASQAYNIPIPLVDSSLISFSNSSGEVVKEMQKVYRRGLTKIRSKISRELADVFDVPVEFCEIHNELEITQNEQQQQAN